jgi:hypothetical protein
MDFREREVGFQEADRRYAELTRQRDAGSISDEEFDAQRQRLMVRDDEGRWWAKLGESGEWHYRDGGTWVRGTPPGYQEVTHEPTTDSSPARTPSPPSSRGVSNGERRRQRIPGWILVVGLGGIALVGIVLVVWVLVPFLRGEQDPGKQGGAMLSKEEDSAPDGAAFDAVFIHRATPENISANSTYLDNPQTNDAPDVILYVTQNWNPGGSNGTYNEHPVGVWYDPNAQRWAIFNQDREPMPDGAAFNVAVLEQ